jgi:hypothetical protein
VGYPTGGPCVTVFHLRLCFHMTSAGAAAALAAATAAAAETKKSTTHIVHTLHDGMATAQHTSSILVGAASTTNNTHRHADRVFNRVADMGPTLAHMHATYTNTCRPGVTTAWPICNQHSGSHSDTNTLFYCTHACSRRQHMQTGCSTAWPTWDQPPPPPHTHATVPTHADRVFEPRGQHGTNTRTHAHAPSPPPSFTHTYTQRRSAAGTRHAQLSKLYLP